MRVSGPYGTVNIKDSWVASSALYCNPQPTAKGRLPKLSTPHGVDAVSHSMDHSPYAMGLLRPGTSELKYLVLNPGPISLHVC